MRRIIIIVPIALTLMGCASSRVLVPWGGEIPNVHRDTQLDQVLKDGSQASRDYCDHWGGTVVKHGTMFVCEDMDQ